MPIVFTIFILMIPSDNTSHLGNTLKELNTAIEEWDKITNKPVSEQDLSRDEVEKRTKDLLVQLKDQINSLSE